MKKFWVNFICSFVPFKGIRHNIRAKLLKKNNSLDCTILQSKLDICLDRLNFLEKLIKTTKNVTSIEQATGNTRLVQKAATAILAHFAKVAQKNKLKFWLDSGTLIGFMRHNGGFVPWDDDIDIGMIRTDYEKLPAILEKDFCKDGFFYQMGEITRLYYKNLHVWVDIFPMDIGDSETPPTGSAYDNFIAKLNDIKSAIDFDYQKWLRHEKPVSQSYLDICYKRRDKELVKQKCSHGFLFYGVETNVRTRTLYRNDTVFPLKPVKFYDVDAYIPQNADLYLFQMYGDYMNWPNQFASYHGSSLADNMSYDAYIQCHELIDEYYSQGSNS